MKIRNLSKITFLIFLLYQFFVCEAQQIYLSHFDNICCNEYVFNSGVPEARNTGNSICNLNSIKFPKGLSNTYKSNFTENDNNRKYNQIQKYSNNKVIPSTKKSKKTFFDNISCDVSIGYNLNWWEPWMNLKDDTPALKVTTEGLSAFDVHTNFVYKRTSFFRFDYQFPMRNTPDQKEILSLEKYEVKKLKHFTCGISLYPFLKNILKSDNFFQRYILKPIFSFQYKLSQSLFIGRTEALRDFCYIPLTAYYDIVDEIFYDVYIVEADKIMSFKCLIQEEEFSIVLWEMNISYYHPGESQPFTIVPHFFRIGWFNRSWERPSDSGGGLFTVAHRPVVHEAKYKSEGLLLSWETVDPGADGINMDIALKLGQRNSMESVAVDFYEDVVSSPLSCWWGGLNLDLWWNYYFSLFNKENFFISFGCCFELTSFQIDDLGDESKNIIREEESNAILIDTEWRFDLFLSLSLRF